MSITGGCLCGAVRYTITAPPITVRTCWCRLCQKIGAGSATVNAMFATEAVTVEGELSDYESVADSGNKMHRRFCPKCGTHVFSGAEVRPGITGVRVGSMDNPEACGPEVTIWTKEAPSWACISETLPKVEGQPAPPGK